MAGASLARRLKRILWGTRTPDARGTDAARRFIAGDVDGAVAAAQIARTARSTLVRSEAFAVLAWAYLARGERDEAERAATKARRMRTPDRLLTVSLVVAAGGPSSGAAMALAGTTGILSLVGATRILLDHARLAEVRAEIGRLPPDLEGEALRSLQVGLVAHDRRREVDEIAGRLAELGQVPARYAAYASVLGELGNVHLALGYLRLAADHGFADVASIDADDHFVEARSRPEFEQVRERIVANGR